MAKVQKIYTLAEAATVLDIDQDELQKHLPTCAPDFAKRSPDYLNQTELDCIAAAVKRQK